jgi:hypothetical protein
MPRIFSPEKSDGFGRVWTLELGYQGQHATSRPPKPLSVLYSDVCFTMYVYYVQKIYIHVCTKDDLNDTKIRRREYGCILKWCNVTAICVTGYCLLSIRQPTFSGEASPLWSIISRIYI